MGCQASQSAAAPELVPVGTTLLVSGSTQQQILCLKVIAAKLTRSFDQIGKMDPFCVVSMKEADGSTWEVATTKTDWGGHMSPTWNHACRGVIYRGAKGGDSVRFQVLEKNFGDLKAPTFCGEATIAAHELLDSAAAVGVWGTQRTLKLTKKDEETGTIVVQAGLNVAEAAGAGQAISVVDSRLFETPVRPLTKSGGGATEHFALRLKKPDRGFSADHWFGKDAGSAAAEIPFYEKCLALSKEKNPPDGTIKPLLEHVLGYSGIVEVPIEGQASGGRPKQMLVLQNLLASFESGRMMVLKIGENSLDSSFIASKSGFGAIRQAIADGLSFTASEGFRLEAFAGQPESLTSRNPLIHTLVEGNLSMREKAIRVMLQRLTPSDIFMYYADSHRLAATGSTLTQSEFAEIVLGETVVKLCSYALACRDVQAPQDFIHSSIGLSFDCQKLPSRSASESSLRQGVRVKAFSWTKSDLSSLEEHRKLDVSRRKERAANWRQYKGGVDRLAWEATRAYHNRFGNAGAWEEVIATVKDFDGHNADDFMGQVKIPLKECQDQTEFLCDKSWKQISLKGHDPTLTFSVQWKASAGGSRLRGAWIVKIKAAAHLPKMDVVLGSSDPYVTLSAADSEGNHFFVQATSVMARELNPTWDEAFELPLARTSGTPNLVGLLDSVASGLGSKMQLKEQYLPPDSSSAQLVEKKSTAASQNVEKKALTRWQEHLTALQGSRVPTKESVPE